MSRSFALALGATVLGAAVLVLRKGFVLVSVSGTSMEPTLVDGDRVLVRRTTLDAVRSGQIVVLAPPHASMAPGDPKWLVKRAVAVPGEPVPRDRVPILRDVPEDEVPSGRFVVLGDNHRSFDSRRVGYFRADALLGVVVRMMRSPGGSKRGAGSAAVSRPVPPS